jgi:hypothetical protein
MDFLKGLFKGKKIKGVEISISQGDGMSAGLAELFGGGMGHAGRYEPLFIIKDHPHVEHLLRASKERSAFLAKEMEAVQERIDESRESLWKSIETYMHEQGLWPKGLPKDADPCLANKNGVIMHHIHE